MAECQSKLVQALADVLQRLRDDDIEAMAWYQSLSNRQRFVLAKRHGLVSPVTGNRHEIKDDEYIARAIYRDVSKVDEIELEALTQLAIWLRSNDPPGTKHAGMKIATCDTCKGGPHHPLVGVTCGCGRHFHFGREFWIRTDKCIVCPTCERAISPLDFDQEGNER